jgi:hypothetical protein
MVERLSLALLGWHRAVVALGGLTCEAGLRTEHYRVVVVVLVHYRLQLLNLAEVGVRAAPIDPRLRQSVQRA